MSAKSETPRALSIAVMALGGQGGGVLSTWIVETLEKAGFLAQYTSVPGVAQRTGATIYYVEAFPKAAADAKGKEPVLALMPAPGDVDIVLASELMEAGRAVLRGVTTAERTTLISSTHRVFAISEKSAMGDGIADADKVLAEAKKNAKRFIGFDMEAAAAAHGAVISAPLFGALAGSGALPIEREVFEATIRDSGVAVETNLAAFDEGFKRATGSAEDKVKAETPASVAEPKATRARTIRQRIDKEAPAAAHDIVLEGAKRCADYQDLAYAERYLERVSRLAAADAAGGGAGELAREGARHLALWMSYEDAIRVGDLKTRGSRFDRVRKEVLAKPDQVVHVSEYLHPRVEEICDILPAPVGRFILNTSWARKGLGFLFGHGRRVTTTKLPGFLQLYAMSLLRPLRPMSLKFGEEQERIESWLSLIEETAPRDYGLAVEIATLQRLIKGYGDTYARGFGNYLKIVDLLDMVKAQADPAGALNVLKEAALADDKGAALDKAIAELADPRVPEAA
ncbi:MAG: indolepyruvate oxidoreductase subunit beta family protein [Pseudomonadota bacterium]